MNPYKVLILKNSLKFTIEDETALVKTFFASHFSFPFEFIFKDITEPVSIKQYKQVNGFDHITGKPALVWLYGLNDSVKDSLTKYVNDDVFHAVIFAWDIDTVSNPSDGGITSWTNFAPLYADTEYVQLAINVYMKSKGLIWQMIAHELMHTFCKRIARQGYPILDELDIDHLSRPFYKNDDPSAPDGNFAETFANLAPYISKIPVLYNSQKKESNAYKYFSAAEVTKWKLKTDLWQALDIMRGMAGTPFNITSGFRTVEENKKVGGAANSAHLTGLAVDLDCRDNIVRFKILDGVFNSGIPCFVEVARNHLHIDLSSTTHALSQCLWSSDS